MPRKRSEDPLYVLPVWHHLWMHHDFGRRFQRRTRRRISIQSTSIDFVQRLAKISSGKMWKKVWDEIYQHRDNLRIPAFEDEEMLTGWEDGSQAEFQFQSLS